MTRDEALVQMTLRWLEAEAKLRESVPVDAVQRLREEVMQRAPAAMEQTFDRFFAEVLSQKGKS